ncbi:MAG: hypothetical protein ACOC7N_00530 [Chloroflexota bacterium]
MPEGTYTYTARSAENPERVVTFTLRDRRMSVGVGAPLEQIERAIPIGREEEEEPEERAEERAEPEVELEPEQAEAPRLWLRPLAVSLVERTTRPVHVDDVAATVADDWLRVRAWVRAGGLRLLPVTLIDGRVDNAVAAQDFVREVEERRTVGGFNLFSLFDYWATWVAAAVAALVILDRSRRRAGQRDEA